MYKHIQWTIFFYKKKKEKGFGLYARQPRKNLHTGISVNKPKLPVTKYDQTLILAHMYDTSRYTANTKKYSGIWPRLRRRLPLYIRQKCKGAGRDGLEFHCNPQAWVQLTHRLSGSSCEQRTASISSGSGQCWQNFLWNRSTFRPKSTQRGKSSGSADTRAMIWNNATRVWLKYLFPKLQPGCGWNIFFQN